MPDINWNGDAASAPYISRYDQVNDNLVLAETNAGTVLLEYDGTQWNATSLDVEQLGAGTVNGEVWVGPSDDLQAAVDATSEDGLGVVRLEPGVHDSHNYPIDIRSGTVILGPDAMSQPSIPGRTDPGTRTCELDAGGGVALRLDTGLREDNITLRGFTIVGSYLVASGQTAASHRYHNLKFRNSNGRGFDVRSGDNPPQFFNMDIRNIGGVNNDGSTLYLDGLGQSIISHPWTYDSGGVDGEPQMRVGGGTITLNKPYASEGGAAIGIELNDCRQATVQDPFVEQTTAGIVMTNGTTSTTIRGGRLAPAISEGSGEALRVGAEGSTNACKGNLIEGTELDSETGLDEIVLGSDSQYNHIGHVRGFAGNKVWTSDNVTISDNGFQNTIAPMWYTHGTGGVGIDTSTITPPNMAIELDDGTNTSSGNPGLAVWDSNASVWRYMN